MRIRIEFDENLIEDEVIIRCKKLDDTIQKIQQSISDITFLEQKLCFWKGEKEYYLPIESILFYETSGNKVNAHTIDDIYEIKYRLYELEEMLPRQFMRISKSAILNIDKVFSIERSLTASSVIQFYKSHKQVYVSRLYYKELRNRLEERRN